MGGNPEGYYMTFVAPSAVPDLLREITREDYEATLLAEPLDADGYPKPTWDELLSVKVDSSITSWQGIVFRDGK